jgi:hypothetical protein
MPPTGLCRLALIELSCQAPGGILLTGELSDLATIRCWIAVGRKSS